jgi:hypothetical protein
MMSKYNQPDLTGRLKKQFLRAAILTLVIASMTASPVYVVPSLAQEPRSNDQSQQKPASESQRSTPVTNGSNWERKISQKPAAESQSSAPVTNGSNWEQQTPDSESQNSGDPQNTQDATVNLPTGPIFESFSTVTAPFTANPGDQEMKIRLPFPSNAVSVWITEHHPINGRSHIGKAVFTTTSVQLSNDGMEIRVKYHLNFDRSLQAHAMVIF